MNNTDKDKQSRADLMAIFRAGLARVGGREAVHHALDGQGKSAPAPDYLVSVGKAASMALGALDIYSDALRDGIVISKSNHIDSALQDDARLQCIESDHPVPGKRTLEAGRCLFDYVSERAGRGRFLFLLSGGASSLVEVLPDGLDLDGVREINTALLGSGLNIGRMNALRRSISHIKGGRLAKCLGDSDALSLLISDVPGDDPAVIGSGLLTPVRDAVNLDDYPPAVRKVLAHVDLPPPAEPGDCARVETRIIAKLDDAKVAASDAAKAVGYETTLMSEFLDGDASETGAELAQVLLDAAPGVYVWGGETSVVLPDAPGRGGRNQHLALSAATVLSGHDGVYLLAAGTDGTDGVSDDAGGMVDGGTVTRGEAAGMRATDSLARADSGRLLEAAGDLVTTGPTGTNVMDLVIALKV